MENIDPKKISPTDDELDRMLDASLAKYAAVDPRPGLEDRILVNLRYAEQPASRVWWRWGLAAAVAAILIVVALGLRSARPRPEVVHQPQPNPPQVESHRVNEHAGAPRHQIPRQVATAHLLRHRPIAPENPKLDQFPSPQPLNEQERMLALYVAQFHDEAVIVAEVRTEASIRERQEEMQDAEKNSNSNSPAR